jgi:hypothetical protein
MQHVNPVLSSSFDVLHTIDAGEIELKVKIVLVQMVCPSEKW